MDIAHIKKQFEMVKDTETFVITTETVKELIEEVKELQRRIDKVTSECGVTWINETLLGKEPKRTELIRQLGEKACDRNDEALKKMEECKVDKNQIIVNGRIFPFNFPVIFYGEAVSLAGGEDGRLYTVTYSVVRGNDGKQGSLVEGQSTEIVDVNGF